MEGGGEKLMEWRQEARERVVLMEGRWSAGWLLWSRWGGERLRWRRRLLAKMRPCHLGGWWWSGLLGGAPWQAWLPRVGQLSLLALGGAPWQAWLPRVGQLSLLALLGAAT